MSQTDVAMLLQALKKKLKTENHTYGSIANELNLSEVSVKRIFSNKECSLSRLSKICELAGTSIIELSEIAKKNSENENYFFNKEQESVFVENPLLLATFLNLYRGDSAKEVQTKLELSDQELFKNLKKLERMGLLEVHKENRIKFKISGRLRWNLNGTFFNKVLKKQNTDFLETVYQNIERKDCCFQSSEVRLSENTLNTMVSEIHALGRRYRALSYQEERTLSKESLIDVRWLIALLPYSTDWTRY